VTCQEQLHDAQLQTSTFVINEQAHHGYCNDYDDHIIDDDHDDDDTTATTSMSRAYSIMLREPVARAMSNVQHSVLKSMKKMKPQNTSMVVHRIMLVGSNYMTWALTAATFQPLDLEEFRPRPEHLPTAMRILSQMDYLLDFTRSDDHCNAHMLYLMHLREELPAQWTTTTTTTTSSLHDNVNVTIASNTNNILHTNKASTKSYQGAFDQDTVRAMNNLDIQLYQHAVKLMKADCDFWEYIVATRYRHQ
jgi:hypothetical protein